jgi:hypothetical protein
MQVAWRGRLGETDPIGSALSLAETAVVGGPSVMPLASSCRIRAEIERLTQVCTGHGKVGTFHGKEKVDVAELLTRHQNGRSVRTLTIRLGIRVSENNRRSGLV